LAKGKVRVKLGGAAAFQNNISQKNTYVYFAKYLGEIRKRQVNLYLEHVQNMFLAVPRGDQMHLSVRENIQEIRNKFLKRSLLLFSLLM
jgi:hypothetical protein